MPLLILARLIAGFFSLAVLGVGIWLVYTGYRGEEAASPYLYEREAWRIWAGWGLVLFGLLGRPLSLFLLARPGKRPSGPPHDTGGADILSPTGAMLHVETYGDPAAPSLIFTHGWGLDTRMWRQARADLEGRFHLVMWDLPGLGRSRLAPDGKVSLERMAEDLAAVMTLAGPQPAVLIGHSIGGMIIQTLARDHPRLAERCAGVVLFNTTYTDPLETTVLRRVMSALRKPVVIPLMHVIIALNPLVRALNWLSYLGGTSHLANRIGFGPKVTWGQLDLVSWMLTCNSPAVQAKGMLAMTHWDAAGGLARIDRSVLVVGGGVDLLTIAEASAYLANENPQGALRIVEDANHMGPLERAELYNGMIADFASAVQAGHSAPSLDDDSMLDAGAFEVAQPGSGEFTAPSSH